MNRLKLDFSLSSSSARTKFVEEYLKTSTFKNKPPTPAELETISNYILWGQKSNGKNVVQDKEIEIERRNKTWQRQKDIESLDELMESPSFDENILHPIGNRIPTKERREKFDRNLIYKEAPSYLIPIYEDLFKQIDQIDLLITYWEIINNTRKKPPRSELLKRISEEDQAKLYEKAKMLTQHQYLKMRHYLVDLRTTQFTLREGYTVTPINGSRVHLITEGLSASLEVDIPVFPLGLYNDSLVASYIFTPQRDVLKRDFLEGELIEVSDYYWRQEDLYKKHPKHYFDFREPDHLTTLISLYKDFEAERDSSNDSPDTIAYLLRTFEFYVSEAHLNDVQRDVLRGKIEHAQNSAIADYLNKKYDKHYSVNYISTIYHKKLIKRIVNAVNLHKEIVSNYYFPENFKICTRCGGSYLRTNDNFVRKSKSSDKLAGRCKLCDREVRQQKKEAEALLWEKQKQKNN